MKYTEDHEWLSLDGDVVTIGITDHAQEQLGDIVFIELPEVGTQVTRGDEVVVIESVKAASDIAAPIDGEVIEVNEAIVANPGTVNEDAEGIGWFLKVRVDDLSQLDEFLDEDAYKDLIE
ncbi:glycine cleavage system protein GcvH [Tropicimonas sp. IMCC34043]|uniref:glycine cleavage system protein GcvH n=1 Tax=Tropicimonas sp. IMCC34043 TaxID=2248760 RepID=UPI000E24FDC9|nr:glycine cleavage system protein GcvH [Tropicimonas sp. IMCC34043]